VRAVLPIASAPGEPRRMDRRAIDDGEVSPYLTDALRAGDELELRGRSAAYLSGRPRTAALFSCCRGGSECADAGPSPAPRSARQHRHGPLSTRPGRWTK